MTSIKNFTDCFGDKYDIRIVTSNHDHGSRVKLDGIKDSWNTVGKAKVLYLSEKDYMEKNFLSLMEDHDVAMIYLTGVFSIQLNKPAIDASRKLHIPVVIATRGEILKNILTMKSWKKLPYLKFMKATQYFKGCKFQVTSDEEEEQLKKYLSVSDNDIVRLPNLHSQKYDIQNPPKQSGETKLIFVSRIHPKKNLYDVILSVNQARDNITFGIYGPVEDEKYWEKCRKAIQAAPSNVEIKYCGALDMDEARKSYYNYHGFLFPTLSENYGHVIIEAIIAGCIPIISRGTTPWDDLAEYGGCVDELHDIDSFSESIHCLAALSQEEYLEAQREMRVYADKKLKTQELIEGYEGLISRGYFLALILRISFPLSIQPSERRWLRSA